jgi:RHS repeat-associated protein
MGGGVGGLLYSLRSGTAKFNLSNGRGDVVAQSDNTGDLTWTASYEAYGKRPVETGTNLERQRANTKEEDPTGLLNEGFRMRDLETAVWMSRDPAGFVDGPNLYAYVRQNPWTKFDPLGLADEIPEGKVKVGEVYVGLDVETSGKGYVGSAYQQTATQRVMNSDHKFKSYVKAGVPIEVSPVYVDQADFDRSVKLFGSDDSARHNLSRYAERAMYLEAKQNYRGITFLNSDGVICSETSRDMIQKNNIRISIGEAVTYNRTGSILKPWAPEFTRATPRSNWLRKVRETNDSIRDIDPSGKIRTTTALGAISLGLMYFNREEIVDSLTQSFLTVAQSVKNGKGEMIRSYGIDFANQLPGSNNFSTTMAVGYLNKLAYAVDGDGESPWEK